VLLSVIFSETASGILVPARNGGLGTNRYGVETLAFPDEGVEDPLLLKADPAIELNRVAIGFGNGQ
jgi:hypothetical protein